MQLLRPTGADVATMAGSCADGMVLDAGRRNAPSRPRRGSLEVKEVPVTPMEVDPEVVHAVSDAADDLHALAAAAPAALVHVDRDRRVRFANPAFEALCGCEAAAGEPLAALVGVVAAASLAPLIDGAFAGGAMQRELLFGGDGIERSVVAAFGPLRDGDDTIVGVVGTLIDVSARSDGERAKAEASARMREQILSIVSHELRSPLNSVQSWSHVLENQLNASGANSPIATRALEGIRAGVDQQVRLIEHLLDASAAMAGELELALGPIVVRRTVDAATARVRATALAKDIQLHVENALGEERMTGDAQRVEQIFQLLLTNAIKFTPSGGSVWLRATQDGSEARITIRDSGKGLAANFEDWLFEPFRQADSSNTRRSGGIGLGLALARKLAERHGGTIRAESAGPHLGATFVVTLPLSEPATVLPMGASRDGYSPHELVGVTALVIDDQIEAREALSALLMQYGARVHLAGSSQAGISVIRHDVTPDIVICDIAMPEEDGYAFVRRLRAYEADRTAHLPVIALSAFAERTDAVRGAGPTFDFFLSKPVNPHDLLKTIAAARRVDFGR